VGFVPLSSFLSSKKGSGVLTAKEQSLLDALEPTARKKLIEIVSVEIVGARKAPTIRVYIDTPDGVSFDQLSEAQAWIGTCMDRT
jgi:ribosome maturation factor RimP